ETRAAYGEPIGNANVRFAMPAPPEGIEVAELAVLPREEAIDRFHENLNATVREATNVIDVTYTDPDQGWAQRIVNTTVDVFRETSASTAQQQARRRRIFLEEQLTQTDSALALAQLALTEFQRREGVASSQEKLAAQQVGLMELDVRREELDADRRVLRSLLTGLLNQDWAGSRLGSLISNPGVAQNPVVAALFAQVARLEISRDSLTTGDWGNAPSNPDVQRLNLMIDSTRTRLVAAVESHAEVLDARVAALDDLRARNLAELQALPVSGAEEVRLVQQVEGISKVTDQLREEYQRARIAEAVEAGQVEVMDLATIPRDPLPGRRASMLALALVLGLMLGSGGAFLIENLNTSIRGKQDLEGLHITNLAVIPSFASRTQLERRLRLPTWILPPTGNGHTPVTGELRELITVSELKSSASEAYRTLRTNLIFSQAVQTLHRVVVTSSAPAEGKTTTVANLGVAFAQQGLRVLIVDCDLRKARLHELFDLAREPGLTQLVLGHADIEGVLHDTTVPGLKIVTAGTLPPNPVELLGGKRMQEVLEELGRDFDMVLLDTPPLLVAADSLVVSRGADGVLLVVRAGFTDRDQAQFALQQLHAVDARVVGAVLNDPDSKVERHGGHYYADYYKA
ncbi:MAG: polysaccharide biosynthesis tyrosine autokinase, partial [Gemmatimonas sp.]|nr:polysaccharide biosynthesis tyrosine autokinase [Gemmatimonas sp.]